MAFNPFEGSASGLPLPDTTVSDQLAPTATPNPNYRGDPTLDRNISATDIPAAASCSFWITDLPPACTISALLASVRGAGRVFSSSLCPPDDKHPYTSAAKLVFFEKEAAQRFFDGANPRGFVVGGYRARVIRHRVLVRKIAGVPCKTRVLVITGPVEKVNVRYLEGMWRTIFKWGGGGGYVDVGGGDAYDEDG
ncbi:hypothetical protein B0T16DRAFT_462868 [Cercophora newfieldiana]|uniref:RRM domain-containing protein n=1 Tax=Cercophora newfieldiana TaxID=92897 RepID=A0AA39XS09_9PEZI|nr:hypothetical protein B0T16DRAFT_462868 [Cercophora newfieldiana]